jgi:hypothetical protein
VLASLLAVLALLGAGWFGDAPAPLRHGAQLVALRYAAIVAPASRLRVDAAPDEDPHRGDAKPLAALGLPVTGSGFAIHATSAARDTTPVHRRVGDGAKASGGRAPRAPRGPPGAPPARDENPAA